LPHGCNDHVEASALSDTSYDFGYVADFSARDWAPSFFGAFSDAFQPFFHEVWVAGLSVNVV
jgi:hypothetical protein